MEPLVYVLAGGVLLGFGLGCAGLFVLARELRAWRRLAREEFGRPRPVPEFAPRQRSAVPR